MRKWLVSFVPILKKNLATLKTHQADFQNFLMFVLVYGFLANYALWSLLGYPFTIKTLFGWGILAYFVREEFVIWLRRIAYKR